MKIIAIIPARMESTRFPYKVITNIQNQPMYAYIYRRIILSKYIYKAFIATDSSEIISYCKKYTINYLQTKKYHFSGTSRITECLNLIGDFDFILNVQADEPLVTPEVLDYLILSFTKSYTYGIATLKKNISDLSNIYNPNCVKVFTNQKNQAQYFFRYLLPSFYRKDCYYKHIGIYLFSAFSLFQIKKFYKKNTSNTIHNLEQLDFIHLKIPIYVFETDQEFQSIDTKEDLEKFKKVFAKDKINA